MVEWGAGVKTADGPRTDKIGGDAGLVVVDAVSVSFNTRRGVFRREQVMALNNVTIAIARGETLALVGESGSGKTTLGRVSLRLLKPAVGRILFDGQNITKTNEEDLSWFRRRAQMIFQDPFSSLNPYMRVVDLVEEPLLIDGHFGRAERADRVRRALEAVELVPAGRFAGKYPGQMSGGQRQRVGIARALVRNPEYIVADEPVSMIDASSRIEVLNLLERLQQERGAAFLSVTHDIASARYFSDRIAVMYLGEIMEEGGASAVIDEPLHPYTRALIAAVPEPDPENRHRRRAVVPGEQSGLTSVPTGCPFFPRCPERIPGTCDVIRPLLADQGGEHRVACHLYPGSTPDRERVRLEKQSIDS